MKRMIGGLLVALMVAGVWAAAALGADSCPTGFTLKFTARESELSVIILPKGYVFCAVASTGFVSGVITADGRTRLDAYLPEDNFWRVYGPPPKPTVTPVPTPRATPRQSPPGPGPTPRPPGPGPTPRPPAGAPTPTPALPDSAMGR